MKERPILFSAAMVRALLDGSKTQTRRLVKDLPEWEITEICHDASGTGKWMPNGPAPCGRGMAAGHWRLCPYGRPGDRLWVRETFMDLTGTGVEHRDLSGRHQQYAYAAEFPPESHGDSARKAYGLKWKPSIYMPRAASRILLEIVSVRVERLNDCSEADAKAEGVKPDEVRHMWLFGATSEERTAMYKRAAVRPYSALWESVNGVGSWAANPWVWVVEFKRVIP